MTQLTNTANTQATLNNSRTVALEMGFPFDGLDNAAQMTKRSRRHIRRGRRWDTCGF